MSLAKVEACLYALLYLLGTVILSYFLPRTSTTLLFLVYGGCFVLYWRLYQLSSTGIDWKKILALALLLRVALFASTPSWSEDYARFLWDGHLVSKGLNPYTYTPAEMLEQSEWAFDPFMEELYSLMNSPNYHSVYPPSNQLVFGTAAFLSPEGILSGILVIRIALFVFEMLAFYLIYLLLRLFQQPSHKLLLYALNPLVIMEVIGNLHFEGMMLTMILSGIYFFKKNRFSSSGAALALAVGIKLSPLMLLPAFLKRVPKKASLRFIGMVGLVVLLSLWPLFHAWPGFSQSLNLYSNTFEFNASIYYLLRQLGYWHVGYNTIGILGPLLKVVTLVLILFVSFRNKSKDAQSLLETLLLVYLIYFLLNTVVHPWYIIPALGISVLTEKRGFILWSFLIVLSYHAYQHQPYGESAWYLFLEYGILGWVLWKERIFASNAVIDRSTE